MYSSNICLTHCLSSLRISHGVPQKIRKKGKFFYLKDQNFYQEIKVTMGNMIYELR